MADNTDEPKKNMFHSEAAKLGPTLVLVKTDVMPSKYKGKPPYVVLEIGGRERNYTCENDACAESLANLKNRKVMLEFLGSRDDASIRVLGAGAAQQPDQAATAREQQPPPGARQPAARTPAPKQPELTQEQKLSEVRHFMVRQSNLRLLALDAACYVAARHNKKHPDFALSAHDIRELSSVFYIGAERNGAVAQMPDTPLPEAAAKGAK